MNETAITIIVYAADILFTAVALWLAMKITGINGKFLAALLASLLASLAGLVPVLGFVLSIFVLFFLMQKWTGAPVFPDLVLMVVVAWGIGFLARMLLLMYVFEVAATHTAY